MHRIVLTALALALAITPVKARTITTRAPLHRGTTFTPTHTGKGNSTSKLDYQISRTNPPPDSGLSFDTGDPENPYMMLRFTVPF